MLDENDSYAVKNIDNNRVIVTGEIPRVTEFEKGFPLQYKEEKNEFDLVPDPLVNDDQALVMNIKNKGLLILTGCGHAGIINTIKYAKKVTGVRKIYSVIGGFHLSGQGYEECIAFTITELKRENPRYVVPCIGFDIDKRYLEICEERIRSIATF